MKEKDKLIANPETSGEVLHQMVIDGGFFGQKYHSRIAKHKNVLPKTLDEIAKGTIHKEIILVDLALDVIESPNVSNETLQYFADLIRPEKQSLINAYFTATDSYWKAQNAKISGDRTALANRAMLVLMKRQK